MFFERYTKQLRHIFQILNKNLDEKYPELKQVEKVLKGIRTYNSELVREDMPLCSALLLGEDLNSARWDYFYGF